MHNQLIFKLKNTVIRQIVNPREKFLNTVKNRNFDIPIFCPAIYDYKATLSKCPLHIFGQDESEFIDAVEKEITLLNSEVVTTGYDIYNIEAEAIGGTVIRNKQDVFPEIISPLINNLDDIYKLPLLREPGGRMPQFIRATRHLSKKYQNTVYIRGASSGPFSLAGRIYNKEKLIVDCIINPKGIYKLLEYCTDIIFKYISGFLDEGEDVVIFDSLASPPLISNDIYDNMIFPFHQRIFDFMKKKGVQIRPLIIGGNTLPILDKLTKTGANQLLLDFVFPLKEMQNALDQYDLAFRINVNPAIVADKDQNLIAAKMEQIFRLLGHKPNLLIGTGILSKNTPIENIQFIRNFILENYQKIVN